jgi:hypothetical protein
MNNYIANELVHLRKLAAQYGDDILVYFIEMAILQANETSQNLGEVFVGPSKPRESPRRRYN